MSLVLARGTDVVVDDPSVVDCWWAVSCPTAGCRNAGPWYVLGPAEPEPRYVCAVCDTPMRVVRL